MRKTAAAAGEGAPRTVPRRGARGMGEPQMPAPNPNGSTAAAVVGRVCERYGTTPAMLAGPRRRPSETRPRFAAAYAMRAQGIAYREIGHWLGGRDHSTIRTACRRAEVYAGYEPGYADVLAEACEAVGL